MSHYFQLLQRYALLLFITVVLGMGLSAWLVFDVITPEYRASTSLLVIHQQSSGLNSLVSRLESQLELVGPLKALGISGNYQSSLEDLIAILRSRSLSETVSKKVNLRQLPEVQKMLDEAPADHAQYLQVKFLQDATEILSPDARHPTLRIEVELSEPDLAARIANAYVQSLDDYLMNLINREQKQRLNYLQTQLKDMESQLHQSEQNLLVFQKSHETVSLDDEIRQLIKNLAELEADEISAQASLQATQAQRSALNQHAQELAPDSPQIRNELELKETEFRQRRQALATARAHYQQILKGLPDQALALARLERQVSLKNELYLLLQQQTQAARLEAARQVEIFRVLDPAITPLKPIKPLKGLWLAISGIISIALGILMASVHDYLSRINKESLNNASNPPSA